ncbi:MAG TPA: ABC transporter permease [Bryobacteraceae bacterium]|jgi:putative ABC transport system permease protein|nr:ABC transporter permease [Bryobacteraceae bacterium]
MLAGLQDLVYAVRLWRKWPGFALAAAATLALGIGVNTAVFSIIDAVLIHRLPFANGDRIVQVMRHYSSGRVDNSLSIPDFVDLKQQMKSFANIAIVDCCQAKLMTNTTETQRVVVAKISPDLLSLLGFKPLLGRSFTSEEAEPGQDTVAILSDRFWHEGFAGRRDVVGRSVILDGIAFTVVGILPPEFLLMPQADILVPFTLKESRFRNARSYWNFNVYAEIAPRSSLDHALVEISAVAARLRAAYPDTDRDQDYLLVPLRDRLVGKVRPALLLLMTAVAIVLLIACANVSIMLLARASPRRREFAIRVALGASRGRIVQQLSMECFLLSFLGFSGAIAAARGFLKVLLVILPPNPAQSHDIGLSLPVLAFSATLAIGAAILAGTGPAFEVSIGNLASSLTARMLSGSERWRSRAILVFGESALALILTVVAGLVLKSFLQVTRHNLGYATKGVLTCGVSVDRAHRSLEAATLLFRQIREGLSELAGVEAVGAGSNVPTEQGGTISFTVAGRPVPPSSAAAPAALWRFVTPGYFEALGLRLVGGRVFSERDAGTSEPVVIINQAFASKYFPNANAIGQHLHLGASFDASVGDIGEREIIGIIANALLVSPYEPDRPTLYIPLAQIPPSISTQVGGLNIFVRASDIANLRNTINGRLRRIDAGLSISHVRTAEELLADYITPQRSNLILLSSFAGISLLLAAIGIYGVVSYSVEARRSEIGIRLALGAQRREIVRLILWRGMKPVAAGIMIGVVIVLLIGRSVQSFFYGVSPIDLQTIVIASLLFMGVALTANLLPTLRALKVDPAHVLRSE